HFPSRLLMTDEHGRGGFIEYKFEIIDADTIEKLSVNTLVDFHAQPPLKASMTEGHLRFLISTDGKIYHIFGVADLKKEVREGRLGVDADSIKSHFDVSQFVKGAQKCYLKAELSPSSANGWASLRELELSFVTDK